MSDSSPTEGDPSATVDPEPADPSAPSGESAASVAAVMRRAFPPGSRHSREFGPVAAELARRMAPRDPVEEMLVAQMAVIHARAVYLSHRADLQKDLKWFTAFSTEAEKAMQMFRRQMLALAEYRRPRRGGPFTAIRHAHIHPPGSTVRVRDVVPPFLPGDRDGLALPEEAAETALPAHRRGVRRPPPGGPGDPTVDPEHGPADGDGEGDQ